MNFEMPTATVTTNGRFAYPLKRANAPETPAYDALNSKYPELLAALREARYNRLEPKGSRTIRVNPAKGRAWCGGLEGTQLYTLEKNPQGLEADCREALDHLKRVLRQGA